MGLILEKNSKSSVANLVLGLSLVSTVLNSLTQNIVSNLWKGSDSLSNIVNSIFRQIGILSLSSGKKSQLIFTEIFKILKNAPKSFLPNMILMTSFLYDIFSSGLASPFGMMKSGFIALSTIVNKGGIQLFDILLKSSKNTINHYFKVVFECGKLLTFSWTSVTDGFGKNFGAFFLILGSFLGNMKGNFSRALFVDSGLAGGYGGGGEGRGGSRGQKSSFYKNYSIFNGYDNSILQSKSSSITAKNGRNEVVRGSLLTTAGIFCAFLLLSPRGKNNMPLFSQMKEAIKTNLAVTPSKIVSNTGNNNQITKSVVVSKPKRKNTFFIDLKKSVLKNKESLEVAINSVATNNIFYNYIMKNRKLNEEIPSGCPLRRMGLF